MLDLCFPLPALNMVTRSVRWCTTLKQKMVVTYRKINAVVQP